jgi:hypothetical protein
LRSSTPIFWINIRKGIVQNGIAKNNGIVIVGAVNGLR